jgi:hypothetical protein
MNNLTVMSIPHEQTHEWLLKKHYAHRIPSISYSFGLYESNILSGICTYGSPCKLMNDGMCIFDNELSIRTLELNRLVINENLPKNSLSYFVGKTFGLLPKPLCLVSYSDIGENHHGYIYQATNWIYTGITEQTGGYTYFFDNDWQHPRTTVSRFGTREHATITKLFPDIEYKKVSRKHRYFYFLGNKSETKNMHNLLKYPILPYPKGDNQRYDASYEPATQGVLL